MRHFGVYYYQILCNVSAATTVLNTKQDFELLLFVCLFVCFQGGRKRVNDGYFEDASSKGITEEAFGCFRFTAKKMSLKKRFN